MKWHIDNDLNYKEVYDVLEYTKQHYSKIINGEADPSFEFIEKFNENFGELVEDVWELFKKE